MKIYLSPSNQNANTYSAGNTNEMEQCNRIAEFAEVALKRNGFEVKRAPKGQDMYVSIDESNTWGADLHIPIHTNAGGGRGALVMVYSTISENMKYAQPVYDELSSISPQGGGYGVRKDSELLGFSLAEIRNTSAIAVYIEAEFHDDAVLARWIIDNAEEIGEAICKGLCKATGKAYIPKADPKPVEPVKNVFYRVQVGAFNDYKNAVAQKEKLVSEGYQAIIVEVERK